jgi:2-polyprenyl-3-methyl-5-hydroxy-6-metoxy-1,4-benzoquinol methylase
MVKDSFRLVRCLSCEMVFAANAEKEFKDGRFYETEGSEFYASKDKLAGDYSPVRYAREIRVLRKFCRRGRILDVGCSTGGFLYRLGECFRNDYKVIGTDVATGALDVAEKKGVPVLRENFFALAGSEQFQAITFWAVLEHVAEPAEFLRKARELLSEGGYCFVLVPNLRSLAVRLLGAKYRYILPQHLNYFSRATLRRLVEKSGFEVVLSTTTHFNPMVIVQDFRSKGAAFVPDKDRASLLVRTNSLKSNPLLLPVRWAYGVLERVLGALGLADNVLIVCRKRFD